LFDRRRVPRLAALSHQLAGDAVAGCVLGAAPGMADDLVGQCGDHPQPGVAGVDCLPLGVGDELRTGAEVDANASPGEVGKGAAPLGDAGRGVQGRTR